MTYQEIKNQQPVLENCFFAFSNEQLAQGLEKFNLDKKDILSGGAGLYGTKEGINKLFAFYDSLTTRIGENCEPQAVYDYEFSNHECSYTNDDQEAMKIVLGYFTADQCSEVKRKFGYYSIDELLQQMQKDLN